MEDESANIEEWEAEQGMLDEAAAVAEMQADKQDGIEEVMQEADSDILKFCEALESAATPQATPTNTLIEFCDAQLEAAAQLTEPLFPVEDDKDDILSGEMGAEAPVVGYYSQKHSGFSYATGNAVGAAAKLAAAANTAEDEDAAAAEVAEEELLMLGSQLTALGGIGSPEYAKIREEKAAKLTAQVVEVAVEPKAVSAEVAEPEAAVVAPTEVA